MRVKFFYHDNDGNIYLTRKDAVESGKNVHFYFYDDEFRRMDWTKEPTESLPELYRQRAQQIRDTYQKVVLCYSGGIDSSQILETFYYNNIHIDEILIVGAFARDSFKGSDENHNGEIYHNAFPLLKQLHLPNTKITVADYTEHFKQPNNFKLIRDYGDEFYKHLGFRTSVHNIFWRELHDFVGDSKHTAYVMGKDKPALRYNMDLNRFYAVFHDVSFVDYGNVFEYDNAKKIFFYTEPDAFKIMLKQYYLIKKAGLECIKDGRFGQINVFDNYIESIKPIIYNLKNPLNFVSPKSKLTYLSARDMWITDVKDSDIFKCYIQGMHKMSKEVNLGKKVVIESRKYYLD
jgi:hypothetical protein